MKRLSFKYIAGALTLLGALLQACSGENGADGRDAEEVNVDSLATAIRGDGVPLGHPLRETVCGYRL